MENILIEATGFFLVGGCFGFFLKIYLLDRQRQPEKEGTQAGGVGEEEAGSQRKSLMWGSIPERDHALSRRQTLND